MWFVASPDVSNLFVAMVSLVDALVAAARLIDPAATE